MPQLSDLSTVSVDDAADVLAARIKLASRMEKTALTAAQGAMLGGGLGLGGGLLASAMSKKKDKRYGRNALVGALMGGGLLGLGTGVYNHMQGGPESLEDIAAKADQIREQGQGSSGLSNRLSNWIFGEAAPTSPEEQKAMLARIPDPELRAIAAQELEIGGNISRHLPGSTVGGVVDTMAGGVADNPMTVGAGGLAGAAAGGEAQNALAKRRHNKSLVKSIVGNQDFKGLDSADQDLAKKMQALKKIPGSRITPHGVEGLTRGDEIKLPRQFAPMPGAPTPGTPAVPPSPGTPAVPPQPAPPPGPLYGTNTIAPGAVVEDLGRGNHGRVQSVRPDGSATVAFTNPETKATRMVDLPADKMRFKRPPHPTENFYSEWAEPGKPVPGKPEVPPSPGTPAQPGKPGARVVTSEIQVPTGQRQPPRLQHLRMSDTMRTNRKLANPFQSKKLRGRTLGGFAGGLGTAWLMGGQEPQAAPGQQPLPAGPMSTR